MHRHEYMTGYISLYAAYMLLCVAWLHSCMVGCIFVCLITCTSLIGWLQELIAYDRLHVFMSMCS